MVTFHTRKLSYRKDDRAMHPMYMDYSASRGKNDKTQLDFKQGRF